MNPRNDGPAGSGVCSGKRTGHSERPRGGNRRKLELMPRRAVVEHGREDLLECGHRLANPFGNWNHYRHCPECPPLGEPVSEVAQLRQQLAGIAHLLGYPGDGLAHPELGDHAHYARATIAGLLSELSQRSNL